MADRAFVQDISTLDRKLVFLNHSVTVGATGAITTQRERAKSSMVASRDSAGLYTVNLDDTYYELVGHSVGIVGAGSYAVANGIVPEVRGVNLASRTLKVRFTRSDTGAAADLETGAKFTVCLILSNTAV